jgi:predicted GNAT superfamily acetyltransferase
MRKNSIVFDWFRKRKKNFILVLEIFLGDKKIVRGRE